MRNRGKERNSEKDGEFKGTEGSEKRESYRQGAKMTEKKSISNVLSGNKENSSA